MTFFIESMPISDGKWYLTWGKISAETKGRSKDYASYKTAKEKNKDYRTYILSRH